MTTVEDARRSGEPWSIEAKLVNKRIFFSRNKDNEPRRLMSLTLIDTDGTLFDIQTWSILQIYVLFRKMIPNESYIITGGRDLFDDPNKEYSTSKYVIIKKGWWIERAPDSVRLRRYIPCSVNLDKTIKTQKQGRPENVLGQFLELIPGPTKDSYKKKPFVQGYFVKLLDEEGRQYKVLVWHVNFKGNKFALLDAQRGDDVLITCTRPSYLNPGDGDGDRIYTITSVVPPVLNSECVSNRRRQDLKQFN